MQMKARKVIDLSTLPDWIREAIKAVPSPPETVTDIPAVTNLLGTPAWDLLVEASMVSSFLPEALAPGSATGPGRQSAERAVLDFATLVTDPGTVQWTLTREARAGVVMRCRSDDPESLVRAAGRTAEAFHDPVSRTLRTLVRETPPEQLPDDLSTLEPLRTAVSMLELAITLELPSLDVIDRKLQLQRFRAGFRRMTETTRVEAKTTNRFFGRLSELARLRKHVDIVESQSVLESVGRALQAVRRIFQRVPPLVVWGTGGVGKTTLMAKFVLEHAQAAGDTYPFAYLDFDRTTISPRDPWGLLAEMCRQVSLQFPGLSAPLAQLSSDVGAAARRAGSSRSPSLPIRYQRQFRALVDGQLEAIERRFSRTRPMLLVFDTFEIVQYSADDIRFVENFITGFRLEDEAVDEVWGRLRLVIAGRRPLKQFLGSSVDDLPLGALDHKGSSDLLQVLGEDADLTLSRSDADRLVLVLADAGGDKKSGVHPLRLRLVGEVLCKEAETARARGEKVTGASLVEELIHELEQDDPESPITDALINGFLVRRILGHLLDTRVRALANPGLVVRVITPEIIQMLLAPSVRPPGPVEDRRDDLDYEPWSVDAATATDIAAAFAREVTLVDDDAGRLRFRQDVRREMLPLIEQTSPRRFRQLHERAFEYFVEQVHRNPENASAAAEALYHGLWLGRSLESLDQFWHAGRDFQHRLDPEEFREGSPAAVYLQSHSGALLTPEELRLLGPALAFDWLRRHQGRVLGETRINDMVAAVRASAQWPQLAHEGPLAAATARLFYRAGEWSDAIEQCSRAFDSSQVHNADRISLLRTATAIWSRCGQYSGMPGLDAVSGMTDDHALVEVVSHMILAGGASKEADSVLWRACSAVDRSIWYSEPRILRLAILASKNVRVGLIYDYFNSLERLPRAAAIIPAIRRLFENSYGNATDAQSRRTLMSLMESRDPRAVFEAADELYRADKRPLLGSIEATPDTVALVSIVAADHRDWLSPLINALERVTTAQKKRVVKDLEAFTGVTSRAARLSSFSANDVVSLALDGGYLLRMAQEMTQFDDQDTGTRIPGTIGGLSRMLLGWDKRLNDFLRETSNLRPDLPV